LITILIFEFDVIAASLEMPQSLPAVLHLVPSTSPKYQHPPLKISLNLLLALLQSFHLNLTVSSHSSCSA
jgi:hypothetical protein